MIEIYPTSGSPVQVMENTITLVAGPYPSDVAHYTYIHGFAMGVIVTAEPVEHFLGRLNAKPSLVQFTRPDNTPVWIKGSAVTEVTPPLPRGAYASSANSVIWLARMRQAVIESMADIQTKLDTGKHDDVGGPATTAVFYDERMDLQSSLALPDADDDKSGKKKDKHRT